MKKLACLILLLLISFFSSLIFSSPVLAQFLLQEDFEDGNADGWKRVDDPNGTPCSAEWKITEDDDNKMFGIAINQCNCTTNIMPDDTLWKDLSNDYIIELDMKFVLGTDHNIAFRFTPSTPKNDWYDIHFQSPNGFVLERVPPGSQFIDVTYPVPNRDLPYHVKIVMQTGNIKIFIDENLVLDYPYDHSDERFPTGRLALRAGTGLDCNSETYFDNIEVRALEEQKEKEPLILLPGLGGSWNHQEIFLGIDQPQSAWYKTPFIESYNGLIQTLQNAGYILNENLFVFYYDWLQPIAQSATDLKNYIDSVVDSPPGTKVDLIGHSLGGLVGRTYVQNYPGNHNVDQLITLGSPHKGVPQVYKAWEGADLNELLGNKERIGAGILLRLRGFGYPNLVQAIQNLVPSLGNLLFIDDYLKWNSGAIKPEPSMSQQNTWLKGLGTPSELLGLTDTVVGTAGDTPRWLKIIPRSHSDEELGQWEDGKPVDEESAIGDRTILEESAKLEGANIVILDGLDHSELVQSAAGITKILELLGVSDGVEIVEQPIIPFQPALVFTVASPVTLRVTDPLGRPIGAGIDLSEIPDATFSAQEKIIIIPHAINGKYKVEVINDNNGGSYQFLIGQLTKKHDVWNLYQNEVSPGKPDTYSLTFDNTLQTTDIYLASFVNSKLKTLLTQIQRQNINFRIKIRLTLKVRSILGQTKPLLSLLEQERNERATRYLDKAIIETMRAIDYAEEFHPDVLPALREILDLLGQLGQLLGS